MDVEVGGISARGNSRDYEGREVMGKLIDADTVIAYIDRLTDSGLGKKKVLEYLRKYVSEQPEAVVRCKECKYWDTQDRSAEGIAKCGYWSMERFLIFTDTDDFCSYAERRTDEPD